MQLRETFRHYFKVFYARLGWILLGTAACTTITFGVTCLIPATYEATVLVLIDSAEEPTNTNQYPLLVKQDEVLNQVANKLPALPAAKLGSLITSEFHPDTRILNIRVQTNTAELASRFANELAHTFIQVQTIKDTVRLQQQNVQVESDLHTAKSNLDMMQAKIHTLESQHATNEEIAQARVQGDTYQLRYDALLNLYHHLQDEQLHINTHLTIAQEATPPLYSVSPNLPLNLGLACSLSFLSLTSFFLIFSWLDTTIKSREDLAYLPQITIFGAVPRIRLRGPAKSLPLKDEQSSNVTLDTIAMQIDRSRQGAHSLLVTSLQKQAGVSSVSLHIARFLARSGLRVLLLDVNTNNPTLHKLFPLGHTYGLLDKIDELFAISETAISRLYHWLNLWHTEEENLWVIPVGTGKNRTSWQLADLAHLKERLLGNPALRTPNLVDLIIFDAPSAPQTDIIPLAAIAETTLVVLCAGKTRAVELMQFQGALQRLGSSLLGVVINKQKRIHQTNLAPVVVEQQTALVPFSTLPPLPAPARFPSNPALLDTPPEVSVPASLLLEEKAVEQTQMLNLKQFGISLPGLQLKTEPTQSGLRLRSYFQEDH